MPSRLILLRQYRRQHPASPWRRRGDASIWTKLKETPEKIELELRPEEGLNRLSARPTSD